MITKRSPFKIRAKAKPKIENKVDKESTVYIYDEIGWFGIMAEDFVKDLNEIKAETIHIRINSPGGDVFDGTAIANAIRNHKSKTIVHIDGLAASISSIIAIAADEVLMSENAFYMFHEAWSFSIGNAADMRETADLLDKIDGVLAKSYAKKTGKEIDEIKDLMGAETWLTADEALDMGMVDGVEMNEEADAKMDMFDLSVFANVPDKLKGEKSLPTARELEKILKNEGFSDKQSKKILAEGFKNYLRDVDNKEDVSSETNGIQRDAEIATQRDAETVEDKGGVQINDVLIRAEMMAPSKEVLA